MSTNLPLSDLLARCAALFPATNPLVLRPSTGQFEAVAGRYAGGHAARWFAATDGQQGEDDLFAEGFELCSLEYALAFAKILDVVRAGTEGYWVDSHWLAIASDGLGVHIMIDDRDGRVLAATYDERFVEEIATSPEMWLLSLLDGHANGSIVWHEAYGLVEAQRVAPKPKAGFALPVVVVTLLLLLVTWYVATHR